MNTVALIMMISTTSLVSIISIYFFVKILRTPPRDEPDSYSEE